MERSRRHFFAAVLAGAVAVATFTGSASAQIAYSACPHSNALACAKLSVPLDPGNPSAGSIKLSLQRRRATVGEAKTAVIALAGGPGQAAIPFTETFTEILGPILDTRDLIVFDQRGTGVSHPLKCKAFAHESNASPGRVVRRCAEQIGTQRSDYTTNDTVADIEAIRVAGGYEKLVLYGTSYGTKVAEDYAEQHPSHVEALILDSVVAPNGPETLDLPSFAAVPRVLRELCEYKLCKHITSNPVGDLKRLVKKIGSGTISAPVIGGKGRTRRIHIDASDLFDLLVDGDLDPVLRAEFPAAVRSALLDDDAPLARLIARTEHSESGADGIDVPLYYATSCEEQLFPWSRSSSPGERLEEAKERIAKIPLSSISPFQRRTVLETSDIPECADWPYTTPAPQLSEGSLPNVPTVILSGANDLRTPTSGARAVAEKIPDAHVVVVPNTGHSVLTTETGECALKAVRALFAKRTIKSCRRTPPPTFLRPTPLAPISLSAVHAARGYLGATGKTLGSIKLTLADVARQLVLDILESEDDFGAVRIGGLRGGWAEFADDAITLHDYSYVPGVTLSGRIGSERTTLHIGGREASHGTLHSAGKGLAGELGATRVRLAGGASTSELARIASADDAAARAAAALGQRGGAGALEQLDDALASFSSPLAKSVFAALRFAVRRAGTGVSAYAEG